MQGHTFDESGGLLSPHGIAVPGPDVISRVATLMALLRQAESKSVEICVDTGIRTEVLTFGAKELGAPKNYLGMELHSFDDDIAVRVTDVNGPSLKSGRVAIGDKIVSVDGVRVRSADEARAVIEQSSRRNESVELELILGFSHNKGLWYGSPEENPEGEGAVQNTPRKAKRSFSFGRKPKH